MDNIEILYEDNDILVCRKPAGIAVQSSNVTIPDMETLLRSIILRRGESKNKSTVLHVIHRLDQPVEGIIVFGRNKKAAAALSSQVQADGDMNKTYLAVVYGSFSENLKSGELKDYIYKDSKTKRAVVTASKDSDKDNPSSRAKESRLEYKVISELEIPADKMPDTSDEENITNKISLVEVKLYTGRFHQIRAQFSNIGHPLLGDNRYNSPNSAKLSTIIGVKNVALCGYRLTFKHPVSKKEMNFEVTPNAQIFKEFDHSDQI
ncbi:RluA family pseudouridine synthase [Butyrivibrio sp. LC3010]|uniref:RluA family pseudouridine synthase n=1 Tax=Butyrivibrio sp. LC3010 TaxID=1280680 RepID=UPI0003FDD7FA|nr:RluA family pseudouridine synthase [Butyrivibrio sp. LC3010]